MILVQALALKLGDHLAIRQQRGIRPRPALVLQARLHVHQLIDPLRVIRVVSSYVQHASCFKTASYQIQRPRLDDPTLVVTRLRPRVREENTHAVQRLRGDHAGKHLNTVPTHHANVVNITTHNGAQQLGQARLVQLNGNDVGVRLKRRHRRGRRAGAGADLHNRGVAGAAKPGVYINQLISQNAAQPRPVLFKQRLLVIRQRAAAKRHGTQTGVIQPGIKLGLHRPAGGQLGNVLCLFIHCLNCPHDVHRCK